MDHTTTSAAAPRIRGTFFEAMLCTCPDCHAQPGAPCTAVHYTAERFKVKPSLTDPPEGTPLRYVHRTRIDAALVGQLQLIRGAA